jgi:hypothetical protein
MSKSLWVDNIKACPAGWTEARTVTEAIQALSTMDISLVSLGHDIQCQGNERLAVQRRKPHASKETFEAVAYYIKALNTINTLNNYPEIEVRIHTNNFDGGRKIAEILQIDYEPECGLLE